MACPRLSFLVLSDIHYGRLAEHQDFALAGTELAGHIDYAVPMRAQLIEGRQVIPLPQAVRENSAENSWALCHAMNWKDGWTEDILRHSYGSYHLAKYRNAALTAEQMGHKNARILYAHYREVVKIPTIPSITGPCFRLEVAT